MLMSVVEVVIGMTILLVGGDLMVRGAASLARSAGVSPLAVGLTIVAFGTSAPELAVSVDAALTGSGNLAFGNIFGSNLANIGLIIGMSAMIRPLPIDGLVVRRELPMMLLAIVAAFAMASDMLIGEGAARYSRIDGLVMLLFFCVFLYYTLGDLMDQRENSQRVAARRNGENDLDSSLAETGDDSQGDAADGDASAPNDKHAFRDTIRVLLGLAALLVGAEFTVDGGVSIARLLGVSEVIVGLTLISVGTSLPELVATLAAVRHGEVAIAVGGVVGSNIFNTLLVCGTTATLQPIDIPAGGLSDLAFTAALTLALMLTAHTHSRLIQRYEGAALMIGYVVYMAWRTL